MKEVQKERDMILTLEELKKDRKLINDIDWELTPEMAVRMYLEWGNIWARGEDRRHIVRSKSDYSVYFVVNCWSRPYYIYLIKRNSEDAAELARIELPEQFEKTGCLHKGMYALEGELKEWLRKELNAA
ncbi:MAG: DVU0772 family protein [Nitrospirota bacterium]